MATRTTTMTQTENRRVRTALTIPSSQAQANTQTSKSKNDALLEVPFIVVLVTYLAYALLLAFSHVAEYCLKFTRVFTGAPSRTKPGFAPLTKDFDDFFNRRIYKRIRDCWDRPVASCAGARMLVLDREGVNQNDYFRFKGTTTEVINLGSYNYLGFSETEKTSPTLKDVMNSLNQYSTTTASPSSDFGTTEIHQKVEAVVADFVGKEDAIVFGMGFATNATSLPGLIGKGGLIISDSLNHCSLVIGCRSSGAKITVFKHNDPQHLERVLRQAIAEGQPRTHKPWTKILIVVEGIYSMEGSISNLHAIVALKKKYKAYLYVDEAHSIGALGRTGRGVCEHAGVNPADVDILMGTFTKSFASVGGYIAGSKELIKHLRSTAFATIYDTSMTAPCAQQIVTSLSIIAGKDGTNEGQRRTTALRENSIYFRKRLAELGFALLGDYDSPVIPILLFHPCKIAAFSHECLRKKIATVVVGFPATPLVSARARICLSAGHTREDLDYALAALDDIGDTAMVKYKRRQVAKERLLAAKLADKKSS